MHEALSRTHQAIVRATDEASLMQEICDVCVDTGHAIVACVVLRGEEGVRLIGGAGPGELLEAAGTVLIEAAAIPGTPTHLALHAGETTVIRDYGSDPRTARWHDIGGRMGVREYAAFPIRRRGAPAGTLAVASRESGVFDRDVVLILTEVAAQASYALDNFERERDRVAAIGEAQRAADRFMVTLEALPISASIVDLETYQLLAVNNTFCERYGVTREQVMGQKISDADIVAAGSSRREFYRPMREGRNMRNLETTIRRPDGSQLTVRVNGQAIEFHGRPCALMMAIDVSDLHERERRLAGILETAQDPIITVDRQQNIVLYNRAAERAFGFTASETIGHSIHRVTPPEYIARSIEGLQRFIDDDSRLSMPGAGHRYQVLNAEGARMPVEISLSKSGRGLQQLTTLIFIDVSARDLAEQLRQARVQAEEANAAKTAFLSQMSHELRTPLNAVLGFAQLLQKGYAGPLNDEQASHVEAIRQAGWHLLALTNDVMDVSRIESGTIQLDSESLELTPLLDEVIELVASQASSAGITLQRLYRTQPQLVIVADRLRLRQALLNLASNAVKYNRPGGDVRFSAMAREGRLTLIVEDTGIGMNPTQLAHLFEPFNRLGREHTGIEGTGIGLTLSRQLIELMGGEIRISSVEGGGTVATVSMQGRAAGVEWVDPVVASDSLFDPIDETAIVGSVLYIEDNEVNVFIIQSLLARWPGIRFLHASDGLAGLACAREHRPDLILLDMNLPDMHGMDVLDALQDHSATRHMTVFALSADGLEESSQVARAHGASAYLTKPIAFDVFLERIRAFFAERSTVSAS